jgi:D-3-phosphoglycerate dehydrogenase
MTPRILICDPIAEDGITVLKRFGAQVDVRTGLSSEELREAVDGYDALVVRSETKVTREVIAAASRLQVIARAGIGVENIDVEAATEKGVVVVNAPTGNIVSAAEHTIALMLALAHHVPEAEASLRSGRWDRSRFLGVEVRGKTLGIIGLGQVGSEVARRARGLEMRVIAHDPYAESKVFEELSARFRSRAGGTDWKSSMGQDVTKGRRTEIEYMNGYIVEKGRQVDIPTPVNAAIVEVVKDIDAGRAAPDPANVERVLAKAGL